jgi:dTDP-4-amino-4,6-dideoxygalactose transaminase
MSDIVATIGMVQLKYIDNDNLRRKEIADYYYENLKNILKPTYCNDRESSYWFAPVFVENQIEIYEKLVKNKIYPSVHFINNAKYGMYKNFIKINNCNNADWYNEHVLSLPINLFLTNDDLDFIKETFNT